MSYILIVVMSCSLGSQIISGPPPAPPAYLHSWSTQELVDTLSVREKIELGFACRQVLATRGAAAAPALENAIISNYNDSHVLWLIFALSDLPIEDPRVEQAFQTCFDLYEIHPTFFWREEIIVATRRYKERVIPFLLHVLRNNSPTQRALAVTILSYIGKDNSNVYAALEAAMQDPDHRIIAVAADTLTKFEAVSCLHNALNMDGEWTRLYAIAGLWRLEKKAFPAGDALENIAANDLPHLRIFAGMALQKIDFTQEDTALLLTEELTHNDPEARLAALEKLFDLYGKNFPDQNLLLKMLRDTHNEVREKAAELLSYQSKLTPNTLQPLLRTLRDTDGSVRYYAAAALSTMGCRAFPGALDVIEQGTNEERLSATGVFEVEEACPSCAQYVPRLRNALHLIEDEWALCDICTILGLIGPDAAEALPELWHLAALRVNGADIALDALGDVSIEAAQEAVYHEDQNYRTLAYGILVEKNRATPEIMAILLKDLETDDINLMNQLFSILARSNTVPPDIVPRLIKILTMETPEDSIFVQLALFQILEKIGPDAREALPVLETFLDKRNSQYAAAAKRAIEAIAPGTIQEIPELTAAEKGDVLALLLRTRQYGTRQAKEAHDQLSAMGSSTHEILWEVVRNGPDEDRGRAAWHLANGGADRALLAQSVLAWNEIENPELWAMAVKTLLHFNLLDESMLPDCIELIEKSEGREKRHAFHLIDMLGPKAEGAIPFLLVNLEPGNPAEIRHAALGALASIGESAEEAVPLLCTMVQEKDPLTGPILNALPQFGPAAAPAIPLIIEHADSLMTPELTIRALRACGPEAAKAVLPFLKDGDPARRNMALKVISGMVPQYASHIVTALDDESAEVRSVAVDLLPHQPLPDHIKLESLIRTMCNDPANLEEYALAFYFLGESATTGLVELLYDPDPKIQSMAIQCMKRMGPQARGALPDLLELLEEADIPLRNSILETLAEIVQELDHMTRFIDLEISACM